MANVPPQYAPLVAQAAAAHNVPQNLLAALLNQESGFNPRAQSPAGAQGIAQFMPGTAAGLGVNPWDPASAIDGAARLLRSGFDEFHSWDLSLAAYNAGGGAVRKYGGIPPFAETINYVKSILAAAGPLVFGAGTPTPSGQSAGPTSWGNPIGDAISGAVGRTVGTAKGAGAQLQSGAQLILGAVIVAAGLGVLVYLLLRDTSVGRGARRVGRDALTAVALVPK